MSNWSWPRIWGVRHRGGHAQITAFQGEDVLTARLVEAIEGRPRKMALLADKSRIGDEDGMSPRKSLEDILRFQNIALTEIHLAGLADIPETSRVSFWPLRDMTSATRNSRFSNVTGTIRAPRSWS
jgi:hypothetical protein